MLWAVVAGAHVDGLGAGLGFLGLLIARPAGPLDTRTGPRRALAAGLLVGAAAGVKAPFALLGIALAWSLRRSARALAAAAAGAALVLVPGYLIAGPRRSPTWCWRGSNLVTFDSFWRLFYPPFGFGAMPAGLEVIAAVGCLALAGLLAWRLPPGPDRLPAVRPALVLTLAWLLVWPLQRPWYDAIAFCLLAVVPGLPAGQADADPRGPGRDGGGDRHRGQAAAPVGVRSWRSTSGTRCRRASGCAWSSPAATRAACTAGWPEVWEGVGGRPRRPGRPVDTASWDRTPGDPEGLHADGLAG